MKIEYILLSAALLLLTLTDTSYANWGKGGSVSGYATGAGYPTADPNFYGCGGAGSTASYAGTLSGTAGTNSSNGNGGVGGVSLTTSSPLTTLSSDIIVGGGGGYGTGSGRQGGAGGIGLSITAPLTNAGIIVGGGGGSTTGASSSVEMHGGAGAVGVLTTAPVINTGTIYGGGGGTGRNTSAAQYGGSGGAAISTTANVTNSGILSGGGGGSHNSYFDQSGGVGVNCTAAGLYILNTGSISGGLNGNGGSYDWAIIFQGSNNTLELQAGYSFPNGSIYNAAATTNNLLLLSGTTSPVSAFDISGIGTTYQNFTQIRKSGTSVWTFTRSGATPTLPFDLSAGTALLNATNALGTGALTLSGGLLRAGVSLSAANALTLSADTTVDANNYTFTLTNNGSALGVASGRTLTLTDSSVGHTGTVSLTNGLGLSGALNVGGNVSGGALTLNGGSTVTAVGAGTVSNALSLAGDTTFDAAGYNLGFSNAAITVPTTRTLYLTDSSVGQTGQFNFSNGLSLAGTLLVNAQLTGGTLTFNTGGILRTNITTSILNSLSFAGASFIDSDSYDLTLTNNGLITNLPALSTLTLGNTNVTQTGGIHLPNGIGVAGTLIAGTSLFGGMTLNTGGVITSNRNVTIDSILTVAGDGSLDASGYQIDFTNNSTPLSVPVTRTLTVADSSVGQTGRLSFPSGFTLDGTLLVNTLFDGVGDISFDNTGILKAGLNATLANGISVVGTGTVDANNYTFTLTNNGVAMNVSALSTLILRDTSPAYTGTVSVPNGIDLFGALNLGGNVSGGTVTLEAASSVQGLGDSVLNNPLSLVGDTTIDAGGNAIDLLNNGLSLVVPAARTLLATDSSMGGLGTLHFPNGFTLGGTLQVGTDFSGGAIAFDTAGILKANKNTTLVNDLIVSGTSTIDANNHVFSLSNNGVSINVPTLSSLVLRDTSVAHTGSVALPNGANVSGSLGVGGDVSGGALALGAGASAYGVGAGTVNNTLTLSGNATLDAAGYGLSFTNNGAAIAVPATQTLTVTDSSVGQTGQLNFPNGISLDGTLGVAGSVVGGLMDMNDGSRITGVGDGSISNAVTLGANVIWDAAGYALTFTNNGAAVAITNTQTLTVQDSSVGQTGQLILPNGISLDGTLGVGGNVSGGALTLNAGSRMMGQGTGAVDNTLTMMGDTTVDSAGYGLTFTNNGAALALPAAQTLTALDSSVGQTGQLNFPHGFTLDGTLLVGANIQGGSITLSNTGVLKAANNTNLVNFLNINTGSILDSNGLNLTLTNGGTLISVAALDTLTLDNTSSTKTGGIYLPSGVDISGTLIAGANVDGPITLNAGSAVTTNQNATVNSTVALAGDTTLHNAGYTLTFTGSGSALTVPATRTLSLAGAGTTYFTNGIDLSGVLDVNTSVGGGTINFSAGGAGGGIWQHKCGQFPYLF